MLDLCGTVCVCVCVCVCFHNPRKSDTACGIFCMRMCVCLFVCFYCSFTAGVTQLLFAVDVGTVLFSSLVVQRLHSTDCVPNSFSRRFWSFIWCTFHTVYRFSSQCFHQCTVFLANVFTSRHVASSQRTTNVPVCWLWSSSCTTHSQRERERERQTDRQTDR